MAPKNEKIVRDRIAKNSHIGEFRRVALVIFSKT